MPAVASILLASLLLLSACAQMAKAPQTAAQTETIFESQVKAIPQERRRAIMAKLEREVVGISTGTGAPNKAIVLFDPHCSYCSELWRATRPLEDQIDFVWVPVSIYGDESSAHCASILDSKDPLRMMADNEQAMRLTGKAVRVSSVPSTSALASVAKNTEAMEDLDPALRVQGVPVTYYRAADGRVEIVDGALDTHLLKAAFKLK